MFLSTAVMKIFKTSKLVVDTANSVPE